MASDVLFSPDEVADFVFSHDFTGSGTEDIRGSLESWVEHMRVGGFDVGRAAGVTKLPDGLASVIFMLRFAVAGPHVTVDLFAGPDREHRANCGTLRMRDQEWMAFLMTMMANGTTEAHQR